MKLIKAVLLLISIILFLAAIRFGLCCYVRYCCVVAWLDRCHPFMTADELFDVVPEQFLKTNRKSLLDDGVIVPHVGYFPLNCTNLNIRYTCRIDSVDRTFFFVDSCTFYFNDKRQLVCMDYSAPDADHLKGAAWQECIFMPSGGFSKNETESMNQIIKVQDLRTGSFYSYIDVNYRRFNCQVL